MPESISQSVGGCLIAATAEFTRPSNATAYTAGDVVSNDTTTTVLMKFANVARFEGGSGIIVKARLTTDKNNEIGQYRLWLYTKDETKVTIPVDNAADTALYADRASVIGFLDFPAAFTAAGSDTASVALWTGGVGSATIPSGPLPFICDASRPTGAKAIYGKLVNITGTTPASGQKFSVELTVLQN